MARIILAVVMVPHYLKGEIYSPYQLFSNAFGEGARQTAGGFFLLSETLAAGVRVYVACIPVKLMLGDSLLGAFAAGMPILGAILLFVLLVAGLYLRGRRQGGHLDGCGAVRAFCAGGRVRSVLYPALFHGRRLRKFFTLAAAARETALAQRRVTRLSLWQEPMNIWMGVIGGTFMVMSSHGAEQLIVQRVLACKTVGDGRKALVLSAVIIFPLFLIFLLVGAMLWVYYQKFHMDIALPEVRPGSGIEANDFIFPIFIMTAVPHVLKGLLDCGHPGGGDVLGQLGADIAVLCFHDGLRQEGAAGAGRRVSSCGSARSRRFFGRRRSSWWPP